MSEMVYAPLNREPLVGRGEQRKSPATGMKGRGSSVHSTAETIHVPYCLMLREILLVEACRGELKHR